MSTNRSGFSMIELVFVIVILGVLAAVAVPRFVATRTDAQIATARSDAASAQKAIVAKVFADNIDTTQDKAPDPNKSVASQNGAFPLEWGDWIMQIAGLDGSRWQKGGGNVNNVIGGMVTLVGGTWASENTVEPVGNMTNTIQGKAVAGRGGCGAMIGIFNGYMIFAPNNSGQTQQGATVKRGDFCDGLKKSYQSSGGPGNRIVPLASTGTVEF